MVTFYRCGDVTAAELEATARWIWSDADKLPTWMHGRIVRVTLLKAEYEVRRGIASEDNVDKLAAYY
ncbi:hypothetical protein K490DRAFT_67446 [Saccharata proteae CBS 121410]|uniref:Uncharacterized protein n=1 Tax=Saccharata proteae CBS 121410 TaxID=1314787 RepID=A0A9P4LYC7_9PEZI|nr:hypothetical protein K490DRAFT_67446 [Saccharata proteae CBS 121410]